jgi:hypothetical protein
LGDFNRDGALDVNDLEALTAEVQAGSIDLKFDVDGNDIVDTNDRNVWITDIKNTFIGDANLDGQVNAEDLNALALSWRSTFATSWSQGDFNADGTVNASDLNELALNWRSGVAAAASAPAVPEPSSLTLLLLGGLALLRGTGRRMK